MEIIPEKSINGYPIHRNTYLKKVDSPDIYRASGDLLRSEENQDFGKIASVLKAFRYKGGSSHGDLNPADRIWRQ